MNAQINSIVSILTILVSSVIVRATPVVGPITNPSNGHAYFVLGSQTWEEAQSEAQSLGGALATIRNADENAWIVKTLFVDFTSTGGPDLSHSPGAHIGLFDPIGLANDDGPGGAGSQHEANFVWNSGDGATFRNWLDGEPNNNGGEYFSAMFGPGDQDARGVGSSLGKWNDIPASLALDGIVEVVPEPGTISVLATVTFAGLRRRARRA